MKLREGWKAHGRYWRYLENEFGFSSVSVVQYTFCGQKRYEAHYCENKCCGFANSFSDFWKTKSFENREDAFVFCEEKYRQMMAEREEAKTRRSEMYRLHLLAETV